VKDDHGVAIAVLLTGCGAFNETSLLVLSPQTLEVLVLDVVNIVKLPPVNDQALALDVATSFLTKFRISVQCNRMRRSAVR
jgi:hypothetical protein